MKKIKYSEKRILSILLLLSIILTMSLSDTLVVFADAEQVKATASTQTEEDEQVKATASTQTEDAEQAKTSNNAEVAANAGERDSAELADNQTELTNASTELAEKQTELTNASTELADNPAELLDYTAETPSLALIKKIKGSWIKIKTLVSDESGETIVEQLANIREIAQQSPDGFNVMQGGCCDGEHYAYFSFMAKSTGKVKIVKFEIITDADYPEFTEFKYISSSDVLGNISHANDLAYIKDPLGDGKDKILVITNSDNGEKTNYVAVLDVDSMSIQAGKRVKYWANLSECSEEAYAPDYAGTENRRTMKSLVKDKHGFSSIAYDKKTDRLVAILKSDHDLAVFRPVWNEDGTVDFRIQRYIRQNKKEATLQGIDCDENYIYTSWSAKSGVSTYNFLQIYDWAGNKVGSRNITKSYEIENIFHLGEGAEATFYGGFHYSYWYTYYTEELVQVKWKKAWKKVKWKKVNGKWKYKKKKVWLYKSELQQVKHSVIHRDAYCMRLGQILKIS